MFLCVFLGSMVLDRMSPDLFSGFFLGNSRVFLGRMLLGSVFLGGMGFLGCFFRRVFLCRMLLSGLCMTLNGDITFYELVFFFFFL